MKKKIDRWYRLFIVKPTGQVFVIPNKQNWFTDLPKVNEIEWAREWMSESPFRDVVVTMVVALPVYEERPDGLPEKKSWWTITKMILFKNKPLAP